MKKGIIFSIYSCLIVVLILGMFLVIDTKGKKSNSTMLNINSLTYDILGDTTATVVNSIDESAFIRPFTASDVTIAQKYYDKNASFDDQKKSIISYQDTYMQNMGVSYSNGKDFDIICPLDGEVVEILEDELVGNSITIRHKDNIYTTYQSIKDISVTKGLQVKQGTVIAKSGTSNISKDLKNHLYFELNIDGNNVNPEEYYDKTI